MTRATRESNLLVTNTHSRSVESSNAKRSEGVNARDHRGSHSPDGDLLPIDVSVAGLSDLLRLGRLGTPFLLQQPDIAQSGYRILTVPGGFTRRQERRRPTVLVAKSDGRAIAYADLRPVPPDCRWQLVAIGSDTGVYDPLPIWRELFEAGKRQAGINGVKRLYATAPSDSLVNEALRRSGWCSFAQETVFVADAPRALQKPTHMNVQDLTDTWAIHQLYNAAVPRDVQYSEAFTSHRWELPETRVGKRPPVRAWYVDRDDVPVAYIRIQSGRNAHVLDILFLPGELTDTISLLDSVIPRLTKRRGPKRVFCCVRSYAQELEHPLTKRGFQPWITQDRFVDYTSVSVRAKHSEVIVQELEHVEGVPRRVPVYALYNDPGRRGPKGQAIDRNS